MGLSARWWGFWGAVLGLPFLGLLFLIEDKQADKLAMWSTFHFWSVSGIALAAAAACILILSITESLRETRLVFLGLAFMSIAGIFAVHGLTTPGHIHDEFYAELAISSWLSIFAGACFVFLSVMALPERIEDSLKRYSPFLLGGVTLAVGLFIGVSMATPHWLDWIPFRNKTLEYSATALTLALLAVAAWRYYQAFLFARLPSQWAMVVAMVLLMECQVSITFGTAWHYSWWFYHAVYAEAFVVLFAGWFIEARRAGSIRVIAEALSMRDAVAQLNHGYTQPIADLVDAIEWKDLYTLGHVRRVASFAVMIGKELGLTNLELRALALGAQMHDVGKIGIPDRILNKPAALTADEFSVIQEHVERGYEIAMKIPALAPATDAIRYHHEKMDGTGYPFGLAGNMIPLHARIVTVADAYDAMTSGRVYQAAISRDEACAELRRCAGTHFDPICVEAFVVALSKVRESEPALAQRRSQLQDTRLAA